MEFADLNVYVVKDILKYVPLLERFVFERVCKNFRSVFKQLKWTQSALQFSQAGDYRKLTRSCICPSVNHFVSHASHVKLPPCSQAQEVLAKLLRRHPNLTTVILDLFSGYPNTVQYVDKIKSYCPKLEHLEIWMHPNRVVHSTKLGLSGLSLNCFRIGLMEDEPKSAGGRMGHVMSSNRHMIEMFRSKKNKTKLEAKLQALRIEGSEEGLIKQLTAFADNLEAVSMPTSFASTVTKKVLAQLSCTGNNLRYASLCSYMDFKTLAENLKLSQLRILFVVSDTKVSLTREDVANLHRHCPALQYIRIDQLRRVWQQVYMWQLRDYDPSRHLGSV